MVERSQTPGLDPDATEAPGGRIREAEELEPGARVGRYVVEERIGAGGMGVVVSARDPKLDRPVAIKVLHRTDPKSEVWLKREAQALARLNHPSIVVIHDVGLVDGRPFIAMERLDGVTLSEWLSETPRSQTDILTVFRAAGQGLAVAHQAGVVHCDFKPANVMVCNGATSGRSLAEAVKIMDFGLARESGESDGPNPDVELSSPGDSVLSEEFTAVGRLHGTPKYMAPEQFALREVGPAADQFAFCISLYEALWSRSPFPGDTLAARVAEQMCGTEPLAPPARRTQRALSRAVLRGLQPQEQDRWPTMEALVQSLEARGQARWWGAAAVGTLLVGGLLWSQAETDPCAHADGRLDALWNETESAAVGRAFEQTGRAYASETWALGRSRMDDWAGRWAAASRDNCHATHSAASQTDAEFDMRSFCLMRQLQRLEAVTSVLRSVDGDTVSRALDTIATLPDPAQCVIGGGLVRRASDPSGAAEQEAAYAILERCEVLAATGDTVVSLECATEALDVARTTEDASILLDAQARFAGALASSGQSSKARALEEQLYFDAKAADRSRLAAKLAMNLAMSAAPKDPEAARKWLRHAEGVLKTASGRSRFARVDAVVCDAEGKVELAIERAREAIALAETAGNQDLLGRSLNTLGKILNERGQGREAGRVYERAVRVQTEARGETHRFVATSLNNLATVLGMSGDLEESLTMFERALAIRRAMLPHAHRQIATTTSNVAETLTRLGRHDEALAFHREAADVFALVEGEDSWYHGTLRVRVATNLRELGRRDEARESLNVALKLFREHPREQPHRFMAETELALLTAASGDIPTAVAFFESALELPLRVPDRETARSHLKRLREAPTP